jgi:hypothetical protein
VRHWKNQWHDEHWPSSNSLCKSQHVQGTDNICLDGLFQKIANTNIRKNYETIYRLSQSRELPYLNRIVLVEDWWSRASKVIDLVNLHKKRLGDI